MKKISQYESLVQNRLIEEKRIESIGKKTDQYYKRLLKESFVTGDDAGDYIAIPIDGMDNQPDFKEKLIVFIQECISYSTNLPITNVEIDTDKNIAMLMLEPNGNAHDDNSILMEFLCAVLSYAVDNIRI